jgi:hypothetical protein
MKCGYKKMQAWLIICRVSIFSAILACGALATESPKVVSLKGNVQIKKAAGEQWEILSSSLTLDKGDGLRTTSNSEVVVQWGEHGTFKINENSICNIQKVEADNIELNVEIGRLTVTFLSEKGVLLSITSPSAQIWVKQKSIFDFIVLEDFSTEVTVSDGVVIAKAQDVIKQTLVKAQFAVKIQKGFLGNPRPLKEAPGGPGVAPKEEFALLSLEVPLENEVFATPSVEVTGRYRQQGGVTVNNLEMQPDKDGAFSTIVEFPEGKNSIKVTGTSPAGEQTVLERTVFINMLPPEVRVVLPLEGTCTNQQFFAVRGTAYDLTPFDRVRVLVNNREAALNKGSFSERITLREGPNPLTIEGHDLAENVAIIDTILFLDTQRPEVVLFAPRGGRAELYDPPLPPYRAVGLEEQRRHYTVEGRVVDPEPSSGITGLIINGIDIPVEEDGSFTGEVILRLGTNRLTIVCRDRAGNEYRDETRVIDFK